MKMDEVLIGKNEVMFLATSVHRILEHLKGEIEIPRESIRNFAENLRYRASLCESRGIPYRHVIYPEKACVMRSYLPIKDIVTYTDRYRECFDHHVLDLADHLPDDDLNFLKTDTHLNFDGMVATSSSVLSELAGGQKSDYQGLLQECKGSAYQMTGDLGSKLTPPVTELHYQVINRQTRTFSNQVGANDGLTVIQFNLRLLREKRKRRLLIFGDSFAERALKMFGQVYSEILFCRTRYLHDEIVMMYKPDLVITESAERYFSGVRLDQTASRFNLLYGLRGFKYSEDESFYKAFNAVLNFGSETYDRFIHSLLAEPSV